MDNITPQQVFIDQPAAYAIDVTSAEDNLKDAASFRVMYFDANGEQLNQCNYVSCTGADYAGWDGNNDFPKEYVAQHLGLTLEP